MKTMEHSHHRYQISLTTLRRFWLVFSVLAAFNVFFILFYFKINIPYSGMKLPYLGPFSIFILLFNIKARSGAGSWSFPLDKSDLLFCLMLLVWTLTDLIRTFQYGIPVHTDFLWGYFWLFFFIYLFRSFEGLTDRPTFQRELVITTIIVATGLSIFQFMIYFGLTPVSVYFSHLLTKRPYSPNMDTSALIALLGVMLPMFFKIKPLKHYQYLMLIASIAINVFLILIDRTRAATGILFIFLVLKYGHDVFAVVISWFRQRSKHMLYFILAASFISLFVLFHFFGHHLIKLILAIASEGRGFGGGSIRVRIAAAFEMLQVTLQHPWLGIGYEAMRHAGVGVLNLVTHVHYQLLLATYGVFGFLAYLVWVLSLRQSWKGLLSKQSIAVLLMYFGTMTTSPELYWWYAILLYLWRDSA